jgi:hypothetical protein
LKQAPAGVETGVNKGEGGHKGGESPLLVLKQTRTREKEGDPLLLMLKQAPAGVETGVNKGEGGRKGGESPSSGVETDANEGNPSWCETDTNKRRSLPAYFQGWTWWCWQRIASLENERMLLGCKPSSSCSVSKVC